MQPVRYQIHRTLDDTYTITDANGNGNLPQTLPDILALWARLDDFVRTQVPDNEQRSPAPATAPTTAPTTAPATAPATIPDERINSVQARQLAEAHGAPINDRTLLYHMQQGNIPGAEKRGGRWTLSRRHFLAWLDEYPR